MNWEVSDRSIGLWLDGASLASTEAGKSEVKSAFCKSHLKCKPHTKQDFHHEAYLYIREYY